VCVRAGLGSCRFVPCPFPLLCARASMRGEWIFEVMMDIYMMRGRSCCFSIGRTGGREKNQQCNLWNLKMRCLLLRLLLRLLGSVGLGLLARVGLIDFDLVGRPGLFHPVSRRKDAESIDHGEMPMAMPMLAWSDQ
jgi:hypothetical protein